MLVRATGTDDAMNGDREDYLSGTTIDQLQEWGSDIPQLMLLMAIDDTYICLQELGDQ